jgi:hypothetical protein
MRASASAAPGLVTQGAADLTHTDLESGIADEDSGPECLEQLLLGDEAAGMRHEMLQDAEGFRRERDGLRPFPQPGVIGVETIGAKPASGTTLHDEPGSDGSAHFILMAALTLRADRDSQQATWGVCGAPC